MPCGIYLPEQEGFGTQGVTIPFTRCQVRIPGAEAARPAMGAVGEAEGGTCAGRAEPGAAACAALRG